MACERDASASAFSFQRRLVRSAVWGRQEGLPNSRGQFLQRAPRTSGLPGIRQRGRHVPLLQGRSPVYPAALRGHRLPGEWLGLCFVHCIVLSRSGTLSAITLVVALVTATGSTLIVECAQREACAMEHHECEHIARVAQSCCHASDASHQGGPAESRVQLTVDLSPHPAELAAGVFANISGTSLKTHTSPPSVPAPDLATRFAPLLI